MAKNNLNVPDINLLASTQALCELENPYENFLIHDSLFLDAMKENIEWHRTHSPFYASFSKQFSISKLRSIQDLNLIPFLAAEFFKRNEVVSIPRSDVKVHLTSSGTSGQKSQMFFDEWTLGSAQRMVDYIFVANQWKTEKPANYLLYSYQTASDNKLGTAYTDNFLCKYAPVNKLEYALKCTGSGTHDFDVFGCIRKLQEYADDGLPVRIFGFPAFFHFTIDRMQKLGMPKLKLHPESFVFLGGGWKGHAEKAIPKNNFYQEVEEYLGIPNYRLRDGFGSVEHCVPYVECSEHHFHVPTWSRVIIRDLRNLEALPFGKPGFLQFLSPYITSVPAQSIMMGDLAVQHEHCGCGLPTPWFELLGRAGTSKNKSCALAAAELLKRSA